jgi:hypothetical protein
MKSFSKLTSIDQNWYWQDTSLILINLSDVYSTIKAVKNMLYEIAWNDNAQRSLYLSFLQALSIHQQLAQNAYDAAQSGREELESFLINLEIQNGDYYYCDEDFSDDSDEEIGTSKTGFHFPGDTSTHDNPVITDIRLKFADSLKRIKNNVVTKHLITNAADTFRKAIGSRYKIHLEKIKFPYEVSITEIKYKPGKPGNNLVQTLNSKLSEVTPGTYEIKYAKNMIDFETVITTKSPYITVFRGIGYFSDRWNAASRAIHRKELNPQPLYSESIIIRNSDLWYNYPGFDNIDQDNLKRDAKILLKHLIELKKTKPLILTKNSKYRFFADLLEFMQFVYTNGIERFLPLLKKLSDQFPGLKDFFPREGNVMISTSELPFHAIKYARGIKEPYSQFGLPPRYNKHGRPEKPYNGKLCITSHPIKDFLTYAKPNIIRELHELGAVTTKSNIGPELEVSFLSYIQKNKFVHAEKVRLPSFAHDKYPMHYLNKYGLTEEIYFLIKEIFLMCPQEFFEWYEVKFLESYGDPIDSKDIAFFMYNGKLCVKTAAYTPGCEVDVSNFNKELHKKIIKKLKKIENLNISDTHKQEIRRFATGDANSNHEIKITAEPKLPNSNIQLFKNGDEIMCRLKGFNDRTMMRGKRNKGINTNTYDICSSKIEILGEEISFKLADRESIIEYTSSIKLTTMHRHLLQRDLADYIAMYNSVRLMLWHIEQLESEGKFLLFLNEHGKFCTKIPMWKTHEVKIEKESETAKALIGSLNLQVAFSAKKKEIYKSENLEISPISVESLPWDWKAIISERKRISHGGGKMPKLSEYSEINLVGEFFAKLSVDTEVTPSKKSQPDNGCFSEILYKDAKNYWYINYAVGGFSAIGIVVEDAGGGGNCFFHAIARQLEIKNNGKIIDHDELRMFATKYMKENPGEFQDIIQENIEFYIDSMSQNGTWADNLVIQAMANEFRMKIEIYHVGGNIIPITPTNGEFNNTVRIAYTGNHYLSVVDIIQPIIPSEQDVNEIDEHVERLIDSTSPELDTSKVIEEEEEDVLEVNKGELVSVKSDSVIIFENNSDSVHYVNEADLNVSNSLLTYLDDTTSAETTVVTTNLPGVLRQLNFEEEASDKAGSLDV